MCRSCATYSTCSLIGSFWSKRSYFTNVLRSWSIHEVLRTDQQISSTRETQPCLASNLASLKLIDPTSQNTVSKKNCNLNQSRGQNQDSRNSWTEKPNADEAKWKDGTEKIKLLRTSCKQGRKWSTDTYHFLVLSPFGEEGGGHISKKEWLENNSATWKRLAHVGRSRRIQREQFGWLLDCTLGRSKSYHQAIQGTVNQFVLCKASPPRRADNGIGCAGKAKGIDNR
jgi:hypothetical protein